MATPKPGTPAPAPQPQQQGSIPAGAQQQGTPPKFTDWAAI